MALGSHRDIRSPSSNSDLRKRTTAVTFPAQPRLSSISELSHVTTSAVPDGSMLDLEHLIHELIQRANDKVLADAATLRHRLGLLQEVLREHRSLLDDGRMVKPLDRLRNVLGQINLTLQRARASPWFRRRLLFKQPIRLQLDDLSDAISLVRLTGLQIRSAARPSFLHVELGEEPSERSMLTSPDMSSAEKAFLMGDRYYFGRDSVQCFATAMQHYELAVQAEYGPALNALGTMYRDGRGAPLDTAMALHYFERGVKVGNLDAVYNLATFKWAHAKTTTEASEALSLLRTAANAEHVEAMTMLGWLHEIGDDTFNVVEQDHEIAERLYKSAAESGYVKAQNNLAHLLYKIGSEERRRDPDSLSARSRLERAVTLFRSSAEKGSAAAINNLAICYENGIAGVLDPDLSMAERFYERAANLGNDNAAANLGRLLIRRLRYDDARQLLQRSSCGAALVQLGHLYRHGNLQCLATAFEYFLRAATAGDAQGQYEAAQMLFSGVGTVVDVKRAFELYKSSAIQGYAAAQNAMGILLEDGVPSVQDFYQARYWYEKAAEGHHPDALCNLAGMYENGAGVEIDMGKALQLYERAKQAGSVSAGLRLIDLNQ